MTRTAVILGGVAWNTMIRLPSLPDGTPATIFASGSHDALGSSGAGKALNLRRLGVHVRLWAALGDDERGERARAALEREHVELRSTLDPAGTMHHVNLMDPEGRRISIFVNAGSHDLAVDPGLVADWLPDADLVWVTILNPCRVFLPVVRAAGRPLWIDLHDYDGVNPYHDEFVAAADVLFLSSERLPAYREFMARRIDDGTRLVVCTHGAAGATALGRDEGWVDVEAVPVERIVDTNGAGDAFSSGFAVAWLRGDGLEAAMRAGAVMGAAAVESWELAPDQPPPRASTIS